MYNQHDKACRQGDLPQVGNLPVLMAMEELPLADARNRLSQLVADVEKTHARITITKHARGDVTTGEELRRLMEERRRRCMCAQLLPTVAHFAGTETELPLTGRSGWSYPLPPALWTPRAHGAGTGRPSAWPVRSG